MTLRQTGNDGILQTVSCERWSRTGVLNSRTKSNWSSSLPEMKWQYVLVPILVVFVSVLVLVLTGNLVSRSQKSTLVACGTEIVYGGEIEYSSNATTTTYISFGFFPQGTQTSIYTTNVTVSETPAYTTSFSDVGACTFVKLISTSSGNSTSCGPFGCDMSSTTAKSSEPP